MKRFVPCLLFGLSLYCLDAQAQSCDYQVSPIMDFGTVTGLPTPQIDVTATITVTCSGTLSVNHRVCLSIPAGTGGLSIADRRMVNSGHFMQYQLYTNPARTIVWGALGESSPPVAVDFFGLVLGIPQTQVVTVYGRVFAGQTGKGVGVYQSNLTPIARRQNFLLSPPGCQSVTGNINTLPSLPVQLTLETDCTVAANPMNFGTVTQLSEHSATTNLAVTCTLDGPYTIALNGGTVTADINDRRMQLGPGPETIEYQLYQDAGHTQIWGDTPGTVVAGTGTGASQSVPVFGLVPPQGQKPAGTYQDTITVTVTF